jgi:hypothetical protein
VIVKSSDATLFFGMNESYSLTIGLPSPPNTSTHSGAYRARLVAETLAGAYHGLESFSQLLAFDYETEAYVIGGAPVVIVDQPRFAWREVMHSLCAHYALTMHSLCTHYALTMHSLRTHYALTMHSPCTPHALGYGRRPGALLATAVIAECGGLDGNNQVECSAAAPHWV